MFFFGCPADAGGGNIIKAINFLIKPASSLCNLHCRYCFYADEAQNRQQASMGVMSAQTAELLLKEAYRSLDPKGCVSFAFQGGEPIASRLTVVWIGGFPYPQGGAEFNLVQDVAAARAVMASEAEVWQLPVNVYSTMEVSLAELAARVRPCGAVGQYLYAQLEEYNLRSEEAPGLRRGENWCLGDSPVLGALLQCEWRGNFHSETAPRIADDLRYLPNPGGKTIRVYDYVDVRFILEDMYAKLALCSR